MEQMDKADINHKGTLTCVGVGMTLGAHITPRARRCIESADVVFLAVSDGVVERWIEGMNSDVRSLQEFYSENKSRKVTYKQMREAILKEVRAGKNVCGAFYGHPGVFALVPHRTIQQARDEGYLARMEPGISAEDCLFADLGVDPGKFGCQQYEASQFLFFERTIDNSAYLILWQIGVAGDLDYGIQLTGPKYRRVLLDLLYEKYNPDHRVILYEAATSPLSDFRAQEIALKELEHSELHDYTTLVIPPSTRMKKSLKIIAKIAEIKT